MYNINSSPARAVKQFFEEYYYGVVVADSRFARDGRFIEEIGYYDPTKNPSVVSIDADKAKQWLSNGAQPTDTVRELLKKASVL